MTDSLWHILRVRSGTEKQVAMASGFPCYVPQAIHVYFNRRLRKMVQYATPMLPGFVFVKLRAPADFIVPPCSDIFGFMRNGDKTPATLSARAFVGLRAVEDGLRETALAPTPVVSRKHQINDRVTIKMPGSSQSMEALVTEIRDNKVFAELMGSFMRVEISRDALVA